MLRRNTDARKSDLVPLVRAVEDLYGVWITGTGRRSALTSKARQAFVALAILDGFTRAEIADVLGLDWSSVNHAVKRFHARVGWAKKVGGERDQRSTRQMQREEDAA
jgi:DNA-binding MarR family transcriptional regulator